MREVYVDFTGLI